MLRQYLHIILATILLVSTTGITVKRHYCLDEFRYASLDIWSLPCCSDDAEKIPPCCSDEFERHQVEDDFHSASGPSLLAPVLLPCFPPLPPQKIILAGADSPEHFLPRYKPPLLYKDILVQKQTFLI